MFGDNEPKSDTKIESRVAGSDSEKIPAKQFHMSALAPVLCTAK